MKKIAHLAVACFAAIVWAAVTGAGGQKADAGQQELAALSRQIAGQEGKPAETVFKNIQTLKGLEAARLLRAMNSYSRALGVSCTTCHRGQLKPETELPEAKPKVGGL